MNANTTLMILHQFNTPGSFSFKMPAVLVVVSVLLSHIGVSGYQKLPAFASTRSTNVGTLQTSQQQRYGLSTSYGGAMIANQRQSRFMGSSMGPMRQASQRGSSKTTLGMFLGNDGGFFGVGAPEVALTLIVGYFILGPSDLYKVVKEVGKLFQSFKTLSTEATKNFEESMENTVALDEIRTAQRDLTDAFSFRRSINQEDDESEAFANKKVDESVEINGAIPAAGGVSGTKKRKKRRRVKKKPVELPTMEDVPAFEGTGDIPDLDMSSAFKTPEEQVAWEEELGDMQKSRMERLEESGAADWFTPADEPLPGKEESGDTDWFSASEETVAEDIFPPKDSSLQDSSSDDAFLQPQESTSEEQSRFAAQLSGNWNQQVLNNEDKLSPLAKIMDRLAILEEEKSAADLRLEEEFRLRGELEEKYYKQKRVLLEEAAAEVQADAYANLSSSE